MAEGRQLFEIFDFLFYFFLPFLFLFMESKKRRETFLFLARHMLTCHHGDCWRRPRGALESADPSDVVFKHVRKEDYYKYILK